MGGCHPWRSRGACPWHAEVSCEGVAVRAALYLPLPTCEALVENGWIDCGPVCVMGGLHYLTIVGVIVSPHVISVLPASLQYYIKVGTHVCHVVAFG